MKYHPSIDVAGMPERIKSLPVCPRFLMPVPWFVAWQNGVPEFRAADSAKLAQDVRFKRCWVCGDNLGSKMTFAIGRARRTRSTCGIAEIQGSVCRDGREFREVIARKDDQAQP